jgi:hypothetical protein
MGEAAEVILSLLFDLAGPFVFERFAKSSLRWLRVW